MSDSEGKHEDTNNESEDEPDEDPKLMLLVEAGLVPGLDDNLQHLKRNNKKKKKKKKKQKRKRQEDELKPSKKSKKNPPDEEISISTIISHLNKPSRYHAYKNCLMMSEWLVKAPEDFEENWIMVPCPPGKRMLVVAAAESTRCISKSGDFMFYFQSAFPGGHYQKRDESTKSLTVLDCIWHHKNKTYYILDVLSWNNQHLLHCDASFRFFWLLQKIPELGSKLLESEKNHYRFSLLPRVDCKKDELTRVMSNSYFQDEFKGNIDGLLFYDRNAPYLPGESPASFWLKPFMIPDIFDVPVSPELIAERPEDYVSVEQFIKEFEEHKKKIIRKERKIRARLYPETLAPENIKRDTNAEETSAPEIINTDTNAEETSAPEIINADTNVEETSAPEINTDTNAEETSAPENIKRDANGEDNDVVVQVELEKTNSEKEDVETKMECTEIIESENFLHSNNQISITSE